MTNQLNAYASEAKSYEFDPSHSMESIDSSQRQATALHIGARTLSEMMAVEPVTNPQEIAEMKDKTSSPEGTRNAELYKQAYDAVIESIDSAFEADGAELSSRLGIVLDNIDLLSDTPYISSVPEFAGYVKAARNNIEQASAVIIATEHNPEMIQAVADTLSRAKQQLAATTVAYRAG